MRKLTTTDIKDLREYERERDDFRRGVIAMKKRRRVPLGDLLSLTFENTDTMRFQVQEMARAERMLTDEQIAHKVETYNQLIPDDGELVGTLFLEIDNKAMLYEWLPKLVGIQRAISFRVGAGDDGAGVDGGDGVVPSIPEDEDRLTREETTSAVHYLRFASDDARREAFERGPVRFVVDHPNYSVDVLLSDEQRAELAGDFGS